MDKQLGIWTIAMYGVVFAAGSAWAQSRQNMDESFFLPTCSPTTEHPDNAEVSRTNMNGSLDTLGLAAKKIPHPVIDGEANSDTDTDTDGGSGHWLQSEWIENSRGYLEQVFYNNLRHLSSIQILIKGPMTASTNTLHVVLHNGCKTARWHRSVEFNNSGLSSETDAKWVGIDMQSIPLEYEQYYRLQVWLEHDPKEDGEAYGDIGINTNRYELGRLVARNSTTQYPEKKQDLVFIMSGKACSGDDWYPMPSSNQVCPERCIPLGNENKSYPSHRYFNIVVTEAVNKIKGQVVEPDKTFWHLKHNNPELFDQIDDLFFSAFYGSADKPGIGSITPFNEYQDRINFYLAIEDPYKEDEAFYNCANGDVVIYLSQYKGLGLGRGGVFWARLNNLTVGATELYLDYYPGADNHVVHTMAHEFGGHGMAQLADVYSTVGPSFTDEPINTLQPNHTDNWCSDYCSEVLTANDVGEARKNDWPHGKCFRTKEMDEEESDPKTLCENLHGACRWIGDLDSEYWQDFNCVSRWAKMDVGVDCIVDFPCYPVAVDSFGNAWFNNGAVMPPVVGQNASPYFENPTFGPHIEQFLRDTMDCVFPLTCHGYPLDHCAAFEEKWGTFGNGYWTFITEANACEEKNGRIYYRRR